MNPGDVFTLYFECIWERRFAILDVISAQRARASNAQERLPLFQDIILFRRQQSLTADSLI
jgi:hypothetical protein